MGRCPRIPPLPLRSRREQPPLRRHNKESVTSSCNSSFDYRFGDSDERKLQIMLAHHIQSAIPAPTRLIAPRPLFRKQKGHLEAGAEIFRPPARTVRPVAALELELHLLGADRSELVDKHVDRHRPLIGLPVIERLRLHSETPRRGRRVDEERLDETGVDIDAVVFAKE